MKREVLSLVVACPNSSDGCEWRGEVRHIDVSQTFIAEITGLIKGTLKVINTHS